MAAPPRSMEDDPGYRRRRVSKACQTCRGMKSKCDGKLPRCARCIAYGYACIYPAGKPRRRHFAGTAPAPASLHGSSSESWGTPTASSKGSAAVQELHSIINRLDSLLGQAVSESLTPDQQQEMVSSAASLKAQASKSLDNLNVSSRVSSSKRPAPSLDVASASADLSHSAWKPPQSPLSKSPRYLGEVSDVHFFNQIKRLLQTRAMTQGTDEDFDSYEQDGEMVLSSGSDSVLPDAGIGDGAAGMGAMGNLIRPGSSAMAVEMPDVEEAEKLAGVYFETVHIAYPFIPRVVFSGVFDKIRGPLRGTKSNLDVMELALLYMLCAIGSYYTSFPGRRHQLDRLHEVYFQKAVMLAGDFGRGGDRSIARVSFLLAQCFYFLAVCRTDSCWTTLGQAVRMAQSMGLHVEPRGSRTRSPLETEKRRRVWYSIYVLDRLLSLQLGRPPAINDEDCEVPLPSRAADSDIDWTGTSGQADGLPEVEKGPSTGDYFLAVIAFSRIVGRVLREVYGPGHDQITTEDMVVTRELDARLVAWKLGLPRRLRFDLGHAFDPCVVYKRQRNMLAVKFHHLRALIHRPYLCYPLLLHHHHIDDQPAEQHNEHGNQSPHSQSTKQQQQPPPPISLSPSDWPLISHFERTCCAEARETARLLHSVSSERDLVHDFPWWQMISCLICAGSILLVSSIFAAPRQSQQHQQHAGVHGDVEPASTSMPMAGAERGGAGAGAGGSGDAAMGFDPESLHDDAETCLKMFEALSVNSESARIARDMMEGLKECGSGWKGLAEASQASQLTMDTSTTRSASHINAGALLTSPSILANAPPMPFPNVLGGGGHDAEDQQAERFVLTPGSWPAEIEDSMTWSAQFFGAIHGSGGVGGGIGDFK